MDEEDTTTFSQSALPRISFDALENMRKRGHLCDVTIKVQNHSFFAHRAILAAAIPYFGNLFSSSAVETGETEIAVEELDSQALESLIQFAYTSEVRISNKTAPSLLVASQFLQLNEVRDACIEFVLKQLRVDNVLRVRTFACDLNNANLIENCNKFIRQNFEQFIKCDDFLKLPHSCVKELISDDDLNVSSEEVVFEGLMKWVKASPDERCLALPELLCEVRMIYLPVHYVINQVEVEELIISSKPCRNLVSEVKSYHLLKETRERLEFPNLKKRPRNQFNFDLYCICACNTCGCSVNCFDLTKEVWRVLASDKTKCESINAVVVVHGIIYMFLDTTIQTFHLKTREWNVLAAKHKNVAGAAIVSNENHIYCFGSKDTSYMQKVRCFDTQLNEWLPEGKVNTRRFDHAAASLGDTIYVTGGVDGTPVQPQYTEICFFGGARFNHPLPSSAVTKLEETGNHNTLFNAVEKYSTLTGQWSCAEPMLTPRCAHGCCSMNARVYVCGGNDVTSAMSTAEVYDPRTGHWNFISSMKKPRFGAFLLPHFNKLYAFGNSDAEVYDPKTKEWKCAFSVPGGFRSAVSGPSVNPKTNSC